MNSVLQSLALCLPSSKLPPSIGAGSVIRARFVYSGHAEEQPMLMVVVDYSPDTAKLVCSSHPVTDVRVDADITFNLPLTAEGAVATTKVTKQELSMCEQLIWDRLIPRRPPFAPKFVVS